MTPIERLVVVGVGLIGGSFALALKQRGLVRRVIGVGRSQANLDAARALGVIDEAASLQDAMVGADFVLLATPVGQMPAALARIAPGLGVGAVVTDGGSTKGDVVIAARQALGARFRQFVPAHPIAGAEKSGAAAASASLYGGRRVVLTPESETDPQALARVREAWQACGAIVIQLGAAEHDHVLGVVSHLPHLLAYALMHQVLGSARSTTLLDNAGSGFRDFTRLASSHPEMWRDIFLANRRALLAGLDEYEASLASLRALIETGDAATLDRALGDCRDARDAWLARRAGGAALGNVDA